MLGGVPAADYLTSADQALVTGWATAACFDSEAELTALLDDNYGPAYTAGAGLTLNGGTEMAISSPECLASQASAWTAGGWTCVSNVDTDTTYGVSANQGLQLGTDNKFALVDCAASQVLQRNTADNAWSCGTTVPYSGGNTSISGNYTYSGSPRPRYVSVAGPGFTNFSGPMATWVEDGFIGYHSTVPSLASAFADVQLPDGSITDLTCYLYDNTSAGEVSVTLYRRSNGSTGAPQALALAGYASTTVNGSVSAPSITYSDVDNLSYSYYLRASFLCSGSSCDGNLRVYACRITTTVTQAD